MNRRTSPPPTPSPRKGAALHLAAVLIAAGAVAYMGITSVMPSWPSASTVANAKKLKYRTPATAIEVDAALGELGLTPKVLCAAGLSAQQTTAFAGAAATSMRSHIADYRAAQDSVGQARTEFNRLLRLVQGGAPSPEDITALNTAQTTLGTAIAQRQAVLDTVMADGAAQLAAGPLSLLNTFRAGHRAWDISESYLGDPRSQHDWVALRDALANDRISSALGVEPDNASHQLLLNAQALPNAANALGNLPNLPDISNAWSQALEY